MITLTSTTLTLSAVRSVTKTLYDTEKHQRWGLDKVQGQYIWMTFNAQEERQKFKTVNSADGVIIIANIQKM